MTKESIRERYLEAKETISNSSRLSEAEKDIAHYKNWCTYINDYGLKLQRNQNIKVY